MSEPSLNVTAFEPDKHMEGLVRFLSKIHGADTLAARTRVLKWLHDALPERDRFPLRHIVLDHLTALAAQEDDERRALESLMAEMASLTQELKFTMYFVSHLATPEGKPHEEGGRVMIRHFKGSRAIGYWSHFMFGLERNQQAEDDNERLTTTFRILKDRLTGRGTGTKFYLKYDQKTGRLNLTDAPEKQAPFGDESQEAF